MGDDGKSRQRGGERTRFNSDARSASLSISRSLSRSAVSGSNTDSCTPTDASAARESVSLRSAVCLSGHVTGGTAEVRPGAHAHITHGTPDAASKGRLNPKHTRRCNEAYRMKERTERARTSN